MSDEIENLKKLREALYELWNELYRVEFGANVQFDRPYVRYPWDPRESERNSYKALSEALTAYARRSEREWIAMNPLIGLVQRAHIAAQQLWHAEKRNPPWVQMAMGMGFTADDVAAINEISRRSIRSFSDLLLEARSELHMGQLDQWIEAMSRRVGIV